MQYYFACIIVQQQRSTSYNIKLFYQNFSQRDFTPSLFLETLRSRVDVFPP